MDQRAKVYKETSVWMHDFLVEKLESNNNISIATMRTDGSFA